MSARFSVARFLEGNRRFQRTEFERHHAYYEKTAARQRPRLLWIGCSDSRTPESIITGSRPGEIFVHRNVANIVAFNDVNIASVIEFSVKFLKIRDIAVCGHYGCGGIRALDEGIEDTYIADWLLIAGGAKAKVDALARRRKLSREERHRRLVEENVRLQVRHLASFALIKKFHRSGAVPRLHGWVYDIHTGEIRTLTRWRQNG
ncbi:MAG: carbonic anhydrase [Planctomycetes bacterium]|nr:carbonic anhydrase [Planctomycetota bacterium]